jgi:signal transduction histidine kinase/CheY-like chemotaxis protein
MAAFAIVAIPVIVAGSLLGECAGIAVAVLVTALAFGLQLVLGFSLYNASLQSLPGGLLMLVSGFGFGRLYDLGQKSKHEMAERRRAEERAAKLRVQLEQVQKMEALGTLAGGIAHDMNNILGVIISAASMLEKDIKFENASEEDVQDILAAARRGRGLVRNLLGFSAKGRMIKEVVLLDDVIMGIVKLLRRTIHKTIDIEIRFSQGPFAMEADLSQIEQALMNLCINAIAAMRDRGKLTVSLDRVELTSQEANQRIYLEPNRLLTGKYYKIDIVDSGNGMDEASLERIFEPFYTTKPPGQGTGLGLYMVYGAIKELGGAIRVTSKKGLGTQVTLMLPDRDIQAVKRDSIVPTDQSRRARGRVLLVDDELLIRRTGNRLLNRLGFEVVLAENGIEALSIFDREKEHLSLVILDLVMPELDGTETFFKLKERDADAKILISSGYEKNEKVERLLTSGAAGFLQKPFELEELTKGIDNALDHRASQAAVTTAALVNDQRKRTVSGRGVL